MKPRIERTLLSLVFVLASSKTADSLAGTLDIAVECDDSTAGKSMLTLAPAKGSNLTSRSYCADNGLYWNNLKVRDARLSHNSKLDTYSVAVMMADENRPVLSHIFSSNVMKSLIFISGGEVIWSAVVANPIDGSKFEISVPDRAFGKFVVSKLKP